MIRHCAIDGDDEAKVVMEAPAVEGVVGDDLGDEAELVGRIGFVEEAPDGVARRGNAAFGVVDEGNDVVLPNTGVEIEDLDIRSRNIGSGREKFHQGGLPATVFTH